MPLCRGRQRTYQTRMTRSHFGQHAGAVEEVVREAHGGVHDPHERIGGRDRVDARVEAQTAAERPLQPDVADMRDATDEEQSLSLYLSRSL